MADSHSAHSDTSSSASAGSRLLVTIVTPTGTRAEYNVRQLRAPGIEGYFGVLPGHIPFMTALKIGVLILDLDKEQKYWAISGGFAEVLANSVTILAETAESAESIDAERSEMSRLRAIKRLSERNSEQEFDLVRANASLARAINRIHIASEAGRH